MLKSSVFHRTKLAKIRSLKGQFALRIARNNNDELINRYMKVKSALIEVKKKIIEKYADQGRRAAIIAASKLSRK